MKKKKIDLLDISILNILKDRTEITNKDLAKKVELSEGPALVRVQRLWEGGILRCLRDLGVKKKRVLQRHPL